ncbi:hypothetical protein GA0074695_1757 [Micromonospora viridifaciens]|uniref:Uncharacterized protein n=1 Tax=Micromonospora viridifaciens TaxID=1881 RepID=A0A1C4VSS8_MICVI|nr:hypothetical protein [Micromonospora viridifaciens]SCE87036.1 hypothetical protein GA0074695_1757 [Micromonospora viridifaciens]
MAMMTVAFKGDRKWWIQGSTFEYIVESVPAGMLEDEDLAMYLRPARAQGYLDLQGMEPDRAERIVAALREGVVGRMRVIDPSKTDVVEFYEDLLRTAVGRNGND